MYLCPFLSLALDPPLIYHIIFYYSDHSRTTNLSLLDVLPPSLFFSPDKITIGKVIGQGKINILIKGKSLPILFIR